MSDYRFSFGLEFYATSRGPGRAKRERAVKTLAAWLNEMFTEIAQRDRSFAEQLTKYFAQHAPRVTATGVELVLSDRKGAARVTQQACIHSIQRRLRRTQEELESDELYWQNDGDADVSGPFVINDERIARVVRHAKAIVLETDDARVPLPSARRAELRRTWLSGLCACPGCSREKVPSTKLPAFASAVMDVFARSGYVLGSEDSREVRIERDLEHRGVRYREHLHIHKQSPGVFVNVGWGGPCAHGYYTVTTEIGSTSRQRIPDVRAWLLASRAKLEAAAARAATPTLTELARRGSQHDKLAKLADKWWSSAGHKLDDAKFQLQGRLIPAREAFEKYATKAMKTAEGACLTNVWSSVILAKWATR